MIRCEEAMRRLPEYIASGEPLGLAQAALREHLQRCPVCADYAQRLRAVEMALRAYPRVASPAEFAAHIARTVTRLEQPPQDDWQWLPWDVWVPAAAFALAVVLAVMALPPQWLAGLSAQGMEAGVRESLVSVNTWVHPLQLSIGEQHFWALWIGIFISTAGVGLGLSLAAWSSRHSASLDRLEDRWNDARAWLSAHAPHGR